MDFDNNTTLSYICRHWLLILILGILTALADLAPEGLADIAWLEIVHGWDVPTPLPLDVIPLS